MKSIIELREEAIEKDINLEVLEYRILEEKDQEIERLHSIIKEVRELIKKEQQHYQRRDVYINANDVLEILDKVEEKK